MKRIKNSNMVLMLNGQPQPIQPMVQSAMFYPNTYINFTQAGEYTKHYYNGTERIASRLGEQQVPISVENEQELEAYKQDVKQMIYNAIGQHLYDEPTDMQEGDVIPLEFLQATGDNNAVYYYHSNHLSSSMYVTDAQQSVVQSFLYAPYGEIISEYNTHVMGEAFPKYSFNAKELDEETGFYYYEARYYAPPTFISRDPLMSEKPWLTPYHYCSNNPVGKVDPSGMLDSPIIDFDGNCLGTDADGWKGKPIVMDKKNFKQGMSHHDALEKGTELDKYGKGIKISDKTWSEIESKGGDDRLKPYVENNSNRTVYYKPEKAIGNYKNDGAYPIEAWKDLYMPVDGIAAPHIIRNEVYKMPDGLKVRVNNFCVEPIKNSIKSIIAKFIPYKRGWNDERWHSYLKASCICFPTVSFPVEIPKRADHSWDNLFLKSQ
ncbi:MAG: RHS repeat-associated core domain-containing protein [Bacteroidales bacterium]|nr:RHS repeat-associated core domain-containing protein [Bacteroidales bacterium]